LALGIERAGVELGHRVAEAVTVGGGEIVHRLDDAGQAGAGAADVAALVDAGADQHRVVPRAQLRHRHVTADLAIHHEAEPALLQQLPAAEHDFLFQLEVGDAVDHQPADPVVAVVDRHLITLSAQLLAGGKSRRPGADDPDRLGPLLTGPNRPHPAALEGGIGDVALDGPDSDALKALLDDAVALAEPVLRADAAAYLGEIVGRGADLVGLLQPTIS